MRSTELFVERRHCAAPGESKSRARWYFNKSFDGKQTVEETDERSEIVMIRVASWYLIKRHIARALINPSLSARRIVYRVEENGDEAGGERESDIVGIEPCNRGSNRSANRVNCRIHRVRGELQ